MARALKVFFFSFSDVYMTHDIPVTKPTSDCCRIKKNVAGLSCVSEKKEARRQKKEEERKFRSSWRTRDGGRGVRGFRALTRSYAALCDKVAQVFPSAGEESRWKRDESLSLRVLPSIFTSPPRRLCLLSRSRHHARDEQLQITSLTQLIFSLSFSLSLSPSPLLSGTMDRLFLSSPAEAAHSQITD